MKINKNKYITKILFSLTSFVLVFLVISIWVVFNKHSELKANRLYTPQDVPELGEILSQDQNIRLKAARKLVERVNVEQALEILQHSQLPHTGEGHLVVHQIGFYAYKKYGLDSILKCKDYFLYACYHGTIIEAASDQGFNGIVKMTDRCKELNKRFFQCVHAAGHSIMAIWNYELDKALQTCDELYGVETKFPEALSSCHNGAFMENLFGVHDWGTNAKAERKWLSEDIYFPCSAFGEKYQKGCWHNQAARIYQLNGGDILKTLQSCEKIGNSQHTEWCVDNLARQIHPLTNGNIYEVFNLCQILGPHWRENCIVVNAGSYYSVGDSRSAINICQIIIPQAQRAWFPNIIGQIATDPISEKNKKKLCTEIGGYFENECKKQVAI